EFRWTWSCDNLPYSRRLSVRNCFGRSLDGGLNPILCHAAAQGGVHRLANLCITGMWIFVQHCLGRHNLSVLTKPALRDLLLDPCLLQWVQLAIRRKAFERGDFAFDRRGRQNTGAHRRAVDDDRAGSALAEPAAKPRALQTEVVPEDVE